MPERREREHFRWSWVTFLVMGCSWWVSASLHAELPGSPCGTWSTWPCHRDSCTALPVLFQTALLFLPVPADVVWAPLSRVRRCGTQSSQAWGDRCLLVTAWRGTLAVISTSGFGTISLSIFPKADGTQMCEVALEGNHSFLLLLLSSPLD